MSSSPSSMKQRSPKRTSPTRTPLQERSQSQANKISQRLAKSSSFEREPYNVYNTTPFPTKPSQVLRPSTIRRQQSRPSPWVDNLGYSSESEDSRASDLQKTPRARRHPQVKLKRSVKALRDLYESQAEEASRLESSSRPSTATSPTGPRPSTANSSRLRSISSSESLSGTYQWERLRVTSSDDLALLPTLPQNSRFVKRLSSTTSFTSIAENVDDAPSSPNFQVLGQTSSPKQQFLQDAPSLVHATSDVGPSSSTGQEPSTEDGSSSPNFVRLAHTSSTENFVSSDPEGSSSPNIVKLGTSSPTARQDPASYETLSRSSSSSSTRKRKRAHTAGSNRSFAERVGIRNPILPSSPPIDRYAPPSGSGAISPQNRGIISSSVPGSLHQASSSVDDSSSVIRILARSDDPGSDSSSLADTHVSLQAALSSSPPRIQYPVVRAPTLAQQIALKVPKRKSRTLSADTVDKWANRLSAVPSEGDWATTAPTSKASSQASSLSDEQLDDYLHSEDLAPASAYILKQSADADHHEEAGDFVSALPGHSYAYGSSPALRPVRSGSHLSTSSRINSLRSFARVSLSNRPSSSGSDATVIVPTWARRYYSGAYRDSVISLHRTASHVALAAIGSNQPSPSRPTTSKSISNTSLRGLAAAQAVMSEHIETLFRAKRPRTDARKSHVLPGVGPLVSNPVRGPATAAIQNGQPQLQGRPRAASTPLDPRTHWAGVVEIHEQPSANGMGYLVHSRTYSGYRAGQGHGPIRTSSESILYYPNALRASRRWEASPHLHHDQRLNTGSSVSRGFGHPFNMKSRWTTGTFYEERGISFRRDMRSAQIACFTLGFIMPLMWFVGAVLPLPKRPSEYADIEKNLAMEHARRFSGAGMPRNTSIIPDASEWDGMDVVAKLRLERYMVGMEELRWQSTRWWRVLNRWMCAVGVVVIVVVVLLAVLGTSRDW